jgi:hypothetical protein
MKTDIVGEECWIVAQLEGILILERELTDVFKRPGARTDNGLQRRVAQLNSLVNLVDDALTRRARTERATRRVRDRGVRPAVYNSGGRLPAA